MSHRFGHAEGVENGAVLVGQEIKREVEFLLEGFLVFRGVRADADHLQPLLAEFAEGIAQAAGLLGAAWGVGFWVEINEEEAGLLGGIKFDGLLVLVELFYRG